jgi:CheY-like chemotaxis protein
MAPQAIECGLDLRLQCAEPPPPIVKGDPTRLSQVLINLVGNGLKFTQHGAVTLSVSHQREQGDHIKLRFDVRDTGIGIPDEKRAELFNPFVQANTSTTRRYGGSGLGLAISQRLIKAMGSTIRLDSTPRVGSHFWFELSLDEGDAILVAEQAQFNPASVPPRRILVAEDVELNRNLLRDILSRHGHEVVFAVNGAEAVELARREQFDVVLMDVQMPVMDGVEATRQIRQLPSGRAIRIIGLTANVVATERERYLAVGMDECLTKPIDWNLLFGALARGGHERADREHAARTEREPPLLNQKTIEQLGTKLAAEDFSAFLHSALQEAEQAIGRLERLSADPAALVREAHTLKGTAGLFGLKRISALAGEIEVAARDGRDISDFIGRLRQVSTATRAELASSHVCAK